MFTPVGGSETTDVRQHNGLNQITRTDDGTTQVDFEYDGAAEASNGNLENDGTLKYEYDAFNRLRKASKTPATPVAVGEYTFDAFHRRIRKVISNGGVTGTVTNGTTDFVYSGVQLVEERDGSNNPDKQYVWGPYVNELVQLKDDISGTPADYFALCDTLYRSIALTNFSGTIVEAYDVDAYGNTLIFDSAGTGGDWWADDASTSDEAISPYIFTGHRFDEERKQYHTLFREYAPTLGRWLQRDPLGYEDGWNPYGYIGQGPVSFVDHFGLQSGVPYATCDVVGASLIVRPARSTLTGRDTGGTRRYLTCVFWCQCP
ncbi:MAG: RHS repeat-associated core domain-containing protein, partial [Pirellulales bacterium]|nr:RHS repeat-associated core domain-containing protein [Pirellulales bacterium]